MIVDGRELLQFGGLMTISLYYLCRIINKGVNTRKKDHRIIMTGNPMF